MVLRYLSRSEITFISICLVILVLVNTNQVVFFTLALFVLLLSGHILRDNQNDFIIDSRFLKSFFVVFGVWLCFIIVSQVVGFKGFTNNQIRLFYQLPSFLTIFLMYIFGVRFRDFNWSIRVIDFVVVLVIFALIEFYAIFIELDMTPNLIFKSFILHLLYPSITEEVIFRGLLLTGLLSMGIKKSTANICQAILFGIVHINNYEYILILSLMKCSVQVFIGYIFGKLYLESKSLTPCILLHALIDTI